MNCKLFIVPVLTLSLLAPIACRSGNLTSTAATSAPSATTTTTTPTVTTMVPPSLTTQAPDAIAYGGEMNYAANVTPGDTPIPTVTVALGSGASAASITYRNYIQTTAGQTRNNILNVSIDGQTGIYVIPTVVGLPLAITSTVIRGGNTLQGTPWQQVIQFEIASGVKPGQYNFTIDVNINGTDYGTIPCTINIS